jgi:PTS system cellobiose-specific IIC component
MNFLLVFFEKRLMPAFVTIADNRYIRAVRDAFVTYTLPMIVAGSFFLILSFPPLPPHSHFPIFQAIEAWSVKFRPLLSIPFTFSFGLMAVWVAFGTAATLAEIYNLPGFRAGLTAVAAFLIFSVPVDFRTGLDAVPLSLLIENLGGKGLFVAIFTAILTVEITYYMYKHKLIFQLPRSVPPAISRAFESIVPTTLVLSAAWLLEWYVTATFSTPTAGQVTLPALVMKVFEPLVRASDSYPSALIQILLMMALWSVGIHGMNLVSAVAYPFWSTNLAENVAAASSCPGAPLPHIVTEPFFHIFAHLGGSGATWPLVLFLLRSRSSQLRQIGKLSLIPAIFNINEPVTFGVPIAFNPLMAIPYILAPAVIVTINYTVMTMGFVPKPLLQLPFTMPVFISGILCVQNWTGAALQFFDLLVSGLIYYPFFRLWEKTMTHKEDTDCP